MNEKQLAQVNLALGRLVGCCANKSGQSYKLRGLLYSLWNGKPYSVLEIISLDHELRLSLLIVMAGFGAPNFFYKEIENGFKRAGLFDWFIQEGQTK